MVKLVDLQLTRYGQCKPAIQWQWTWVKASNWVEVDSGLEIDLISGGFFVDPITNNRLESLRGLSLKILQIHRNYHESTPWETSQRWNRVRGSATTHVAVGMFASWHVRYGNPTRHWRKHQLVECLQKICGPRLFISQYWKWVAAIPHIRHHKNIPHCHHGYDLS